MYGSGGIDLISRSPILNSPVNFTSSELQKQGLRTKYPAITFNYSFLEVEPGWKIAYVQTGNTNGIPVLFVHGGPGGRFNDSDLSWFDPDKYRIIAFDQRGTGCSDPSAESSHFEPSIFCSIDVHTFISDMELLRKHLGIDRWLIFGGSWGSTLSLCYAQEHPEHTHGLILRGVSLVSHKENDRLFSAKALTKEIGAKWEFKSLYALYEHAENNGEKIEENSTSILRIYEKLIFSDEDYKAMHLWGKYEDYVDNPTPENLILMLKLPRKAKELSPTVRSHAIFEVLFFKYFPEEMNLLDSKRLRKMSHIPVKIVQGAQDSVCPPEIAQELTTELKKAGGNVDLKILEGEKHSPNTPAMTDALITFTDTFMPLIV
jgi:proline iminopeptidase